jgi:hypothetical protein
VFGSEPIKELEIPRFINDYNQFMGGVDIANQLREAYETHRITLRNWWPIFYWFLDVACVNAYRLHQIHFTQLGGKALSHLDFRVQLTAKLFSYSTSAQLQYLKLELSGRRLFGSEFQDIHYWIQLPKQATCVWCLHDTRCQRVLNKGAISKKRAKRSRKGCAFCEVALCVEGECWSRFHSNNANY